MPDLNTRKKLMEDLKNIGSFDKQGNTRDAFHDIMEKMAEEGMITMADGKKPGRNDLDYDELDRMFIRVNDNDDPYTFNATDADELDNGNKHIYSADLTEKPLTKEEYGEKACGKAPKKPGFFRKMLDSIKKNVFRMKDGDKQCRDYEKYLENVYYAQKDAGYDPEKPETVEKNERELAVRSYILAGNAREGKELPADYKVTEDPEYQRMMNDPRTDIFVNAETTQDYLKMLRESGFTTPELLEGSSGKTMFQNYAEDPELYGAQNHLMGGMVLAGNALQDFNEEKREERAQAARQDLINKRADSAMKQIGSKLDGPDNERFLNELNGVLRKDTPASNKMLSVLPNTSPVVLETLSEEYERNIGNKEYSLEAKLTGLVTGSPEAKAQLKEQLQEQKTDELNNAKDHIDLGSLGGK